MYPINLNNDHTYYIIKKINWLMTEENISQTRKTFCNVLALSDKARQTKSSLSWPLVQHPCPRPHITLLAPTLIHSNFQKEFRRLKVVSMTILHPPHSVCVQLMSAPVHSVTPAATQPRLKQLSFASQTQTWPQSFSTGVLVAEFFPKNCHFFVCHPEP